MNKIEQHLPLAVSARDVESVVTCNGSHLVQVRYNYAHNCNQELNRNAAAYSVTACNSHDALVSALRESMVAMARAGANADMNHPQRNAWEHARSVLEKLSQIRGGGK